MIEWAMKPTAPTHKRNGKLLRWLNKRSRARGGFLSFTNEGAANALGITNMRSYGRALGNIQSRTDFACYLAGLPPLGLAADQPFANSWEQQGRPWAYPVEKMRAAARARRWTDGDFELIETRLHGLKGQGHLLWKQEHLDNDAALRAWAFRVAEQAERDESSRTNKVIFARIGWMQAYCGPVPGDERAIGGGSYNKRKLGHEAWNFKKANGRLYGYFQPASAGVALQRVKLESTQVDELDRVTVVFVARRPSGRQVIVGWYRNAQLFRRLRPQSPGKPAGVGYYCSAKSRDCVLLPIHHRQHEIPQGKGGMGQRNVCYPLTADGLTKTNTWMPNALKFIVEYGSSNLLERPETDAEDESAAVIDAALARARGQGFARTAKERRMLEMHAMDRASRYFQRQKYTVEDVHTRMPYDLVCRRGDEELHVEVKGTTTAGDAIVLTHGEVKHASNSRNSCALFILHSIRLTKRSASGGKIAITTPWKLKPANLTPVSYTYRLM